MISAAISANIPGESPVLRAVVVLRVHEDDEVRLGGEAPAHRVRRDEHLHGARRVQREDRLLLSLGEPLVQEGDAVRDGVRERALLEHRDERRDVLGARVEEAARRVVGRRVSKHVHRGELHLRDKPGGVAVSARTSRRISRRILACLALGTKMIAGLSAAWLTTE